jgi:two-component system, NtrC family, sensor histidine kinase HydH
MDVAHFESLQRYVGFGASQATCLERFLPQARQYFDAIVDDFYTTLEAHPSANAAITGGPAQVERLKRTLVGWLNSLLSGQYDADYLTQHARIGRVHVRISLPQEFMFTAVNRVRSSLVRVARDLQGQDADATIHSVNQILDLELAIMLDTYRDDLTDRVRTAERLSTIGQLAASIGHELRNPLGVTESSLYLLNQRLQALQVSDPIVAKHSHRIHQQVELCSRTIAALLEMTRDTAPQRVRVRLSDSLARVLANRPPTAGVQLEQDFSSELTLDADPDQLDQLLSNLLGNAFSFVSANGRVAVSGSAQRGGVEFYVSDDGPGVPEANRSKIFDVLFTTRTHGTGLGLALCRSIVQRHGGEIELVTARDRPLATGACFRVWLPSFGG